MKGKTKNQDRQISHHAIYVVAGQFPEVTTCGKKISKKRFYPLIWGEHWRGVRCKSCLKKRVEAFLDAR